MGSGLSRRYSIEICDVEAGVTAFMTALDLDAKERRDVLSHIDTRVRAVALAAKPKRAANTNRTGRGGRTR